MDALAFDTRRAARTMLAVIATMVVIQVLQSVFAPNVANAARWGGGYEVRKTYFGYIVYCEEPVEFLAHTQATKTRLWRETAFRAYGADLAKAVRERDNLNTWFRVVAQTSPTVGSWWAKRCINETGWPIRNSIRAHGYDGFDGRDGEVNGYRLATGSSIGSVERGF